MNAIFNPEIFVIDFSIFNQNDNAMFRNDIIKNTDSEQVRNKSKTNI